VNVCKISRESVEDALVHSQYSSTSRTGFWDVLYLLQLCPVESSFQIQTVYLSPSHTQPMAIGVGMTITSHPLHRSGCRLPHPAPASGI